MSATMAIGVMGMARMAGIRVALMSGVTALVSGLMSRVAVSAAPGLGRWGHRQRKGQSENRGQSQGAFTLVNMVSPPFYPAAARG